MNYASKARTSNLSKTHYRTLQTNPFKTRPWRWQQDGCTHTTPIDYLHQETQVLKVWDYWNMRGIQILALATSTPQHPPTLYMANHPARQRRVKMSPCDRYHKQLLASVPPHPRRKNMHISPTKPFNHSKTTPYGKHNHQIFSPLKNPFPGW